MKNSKFKNILITSIIFIGSAPSFGNEIIMKEFQDRAKKENSAFTNFSIENGEKLFRSERVNSKGDKISCMTCHTENPKAIGRTRANKDISPIAPIANSQRFTDLAKVEKWFLRNCKDVLDRECTTLEKGNFIKFMMSIK
jgi:hypothetical protein